MCLSNRDGCEIRVEEKICGGLIFEFKSEIQSLEVPNLGDEIYGTAFKIFILKQKRNNWSEFVIRRLKSSPRVVLHAAPLGVSCCPLTLDGGEFPSHGTAGCFPYAQPLGLDAPGGCLVGAGVGGGGHWRKQKVFWIK